MHAHTSGISADLEVQWNDLGSLLYTQLALALGQWLLTITLTRIFTGSMSKLSKKALHYTASGLNIS